MLQLFPILFLVSIFAFLMLHLTPGDPAIILAGDDATPEMVEAIRRRMGLDKPLPVQYGIWLRGVLQGDLGNSYINHFPVARLILNRLPVTIHLTIGAMFIALLISIPAGILSGVYPGSIIDLGFSGFVALGLTVPVFWLGVLLILVFALHFRWLPPSEFVSFFEDPIQSLRHLILPSLTLGVGAAAIQTRFIKTAILEVMGEEYIRTAYAKGLRQRTVVLRHVLRNAAIPIVTVLGLQMGSLLAGTVLTETVFVLPGLGRLVVRATLSKDYTVVQGTVLFIVTLFIGVNLLVDIAYAFLNPLIRYGRRE
jgi:peptide/nickel transport system permease protein